MQKILIVEDEQMIADMVTMVLKARGYEVIHTPDGSKAIVMAAVHQPSLIILDIMLPGLDGFSIQNKLYEDETLKKIPVIMMTSKSQMEDVFKTAPNVAAFIAKPFSMKELMEKVTSVCPPA